jgi:WD40 repeat protein
MELANQFAIKSLLRSDPGTTASSGDRFGEVKLWDVTSAGLARLSQPGEQILAGQFSHLAFLSDHRTLVSSGLQVSFSDTRSRESGWTLPHDPWRAAVRVSPDERLLAQAQVDGTVKVLNLPALNLLATLPAASTNEVRRLFFTPDSRFILTATVLQPTAGGGLFPGETSVRLWEATGKLMFERDLGLEIEGLVMSPDGRFFALSFGGRIELFDTHTFARQHEIPDGRAYLRALAISPDNRLLAAAGSLDASVRLWNLETREMLHELQGHTDFISGVAFSPDGRTLATASHNQTVRLWNVENGQEMLTLPQKGGAYEVVFSGDGNTLAVGTYAIDVAEGLSAAFAVRLYHAPSFEEIDRPLPLVQRGFP